VQVAAGGSAEFSCSALTDPALLPSLTVTWLRNEKPLGKYFHKFNLHANEVLKGLSSVILWGSEMVLRINQ
jgi:hypothetical protein